MHERIKKLRKALGLTQKEFGQRIGVKPNTIGTYEIGRNEPIDAVISLICREFNVNADWLRNGTGEMFLQRNREDEIAAAVDRLLSGESAQFKRRLILALSSLKEDQWVLLEEKLREIAGDRAGGDTAAAALPAQEEEARAEATALYQEILLEKNQEEKSSVSQSDTGNTGKRAI